MLILYEMLHTCSVMHTQRRCKFENTKHRCLRMFLHKCNLHCSGRNQYKRGYFFKSYHKFSEFNLFFIHPILFWIDELIHLYSIYISSMNIEFHLWYENYRRHFQIYLQWKCLNFNYNMYNFTEVYSQGSNWLQVSTGLGSGLAPNRRETITRINADPIHRRIYTALGGNNKITKTGRSFHCGSVHLA